MSLHVAFLRAINVGGRTVRMDALRSAFEALDLEDVQTFIASGNVIFRSRRTARTLEPAIEKHLARMLGWGVATFVRGQDELGVIAAGSPFEVSDGTTHVAFLRAPPASEARQALESFRSDRDVLRVHGREVYWLIRGRMMDSAMSGARMEKMVGMPATVRNLRTVQRIAERLHGA